MINFKDSITNQIKIKLLNKNILILKGNTSEYISPKILGLSIKKPIEENIDDKKTKKEYLEKLIEFNNLDILTFNQYLLHFFYQDEDLNFDNIYLYNSNWENEAKIVHGNIKIINENNSKEDKEISNNDTNNSNLSLLSEIAFQSVTDNKLNNEDLVSKLKKAVIKKIQNNSSSENNLFIYDLGEATFNDRNNELNISEVNKIIDLLTNEISVITHTKKPEEFKLVIIIKNDQIFNSLLFNKNYEISSLVIPNPNLEERKTFFNVRGFLFKNLISKLDTNKEINNAASITNGLTFRELIQLETFSRKWENIKDFKELYRLCFFEKKESEWEKINPLSLENFVNNFNEKVKGQQHVAIKIKETLIRSKVGLQGILQSSDISQNFKPKGILFFAGPTGVGKTESVKVLSEFIFNDSNQIIRFDMSEYNHEESDQKLLGAAPGYVGYEAGGTLTNSVMQKPFSILLFDEIEKAHQKIFDKFLQILEDGRLTSSKGELVDFSETFIIFTSNIGADNIPKESNDEDIKKHFINSVTKHFVERLKRPEILNRIGISNIVPFNMISSKGIKLSIIKSKIEKVKEFLLKEKSIKLELDDSINDYFSLVVDKIDNSMGARSIIIFLENDFIKIISNMIFKNKEKIDDKLNSLDSGSFIRMRLKFTPNNEFKEEIL